MNKEFSMGNDKHQTNEVTKFKFQGKEHLFVIVPENFPIPEEGIIGTPFLYSYQFNLSNNSLQLDDKVYPLEYDGILIPKNTIKMITVKTNRKQGHILIEDNPYIPNSIYRIVDSQVMIPVSNEAETDLRLSDEEINYKFINVGPEREERITYITQKELNARLKLLNEKLRLKHIEDAHRTQIQKIVISYHDIFSLQGDPLPCTSLASHKIIVKDEANINIRQPRHPECHKEEISNQVNEMLNKRIIEASDSPFNSPLWVVPKKRDASGKSKWRLVIDFRKLNENKSRCLPTSSNRRDSGPPWKSKILFSL